MDENMMGPAEMNSIAYLKKKRKLQAELLGMPLRKHVCCGQTLEPASSAESCNESKKVRSIILAGGSEESDPESDKHGYSFDENSDSFVSSQFSKNSHSSMDPSTSTATWGDPSSSVIDVYSLESRSLTKSNFSKSDTEEVDFLHDDHELYASDGYEDHLRQLEILADCSCSEQCKHKDLGDMLYSNGVAPCNYVLSSGRWSVNQDTQQGSQKLTIDKEFEQYFSMLMM